MKLLKTMLFLVVMMGLVLGSTMPALAAPDDVKPPWAGAKMKIVRGDVMAVGDDSITVQTRDGKSLEIFIEESSKFRLPIWGKSAKLEDIQIGMQVVAFAYQKNSDWFARYIVVIPGKPQYRHYLGEVTEYKPGESITIKTRSDDEITFKIVGELKILPPGATVEGWVTVISRRLPATDEFVAIGVVVHPERLAIQEELREQLRERLRWREMEQLRLWELERITGTIVSIDETNTTLTLDGTLLDYNEDTIIVLKGVIGLEAGQSATVFYKEQEDGTLLAKLILVNVGPPEVEETE